MNILEKFQQQLEEQPDKVVLLSKDNSLNFSELDNVSNYIAGKVVNGTEFQTVPFVVKDSVYVLPIILGILKSGKIPLPLIQGLDFIKAINRVQDVDFDMVLTDFLIDKQFENLNVFNIASIEAIKKKKIFFLFGT